MKIRAGSVQEAVDLAKRMPDFSNPYNLNAPETPPPQLDHILIAEIDGTPVGFRAGSRHAPDTFAVWLAGVLPAYRRRGIGGALYRAQKSWLQTQGYRFLRTHVRNSNRVMLNILIKNGYRVVDVVRYGDIDRNKVVFAKDLLHRDSPMIAGPLVVGLLRTRLHDGGRDLQSWLRSLTISWLRFKYSGRIIEDSSVDEIMKQASQAGYRYCLILGYGTIVSHAWKLNLAGPIEKWANGRDFLAAGAVIQQNGAGSGIQPDGLLVNLAWYAKLSRPQYDEPARLPVETTVPSEPHNGLLERRLPGRGLLDASLAAGFPVGPLPAEIGECLLNIAPRNATEANRLTELSGPAIATNELTDDELSEGALKFLRVIQKQVRNSRRGIFVWNFEQYDNVNRPPTGFKPPIATLYGVAAGLKTNWILKTHGFDDNTRLVYFDYSPQALEFKRVLHAEWDGRNYPDFVRNLFQKIRPGDAFYQLWGGVTPETIDWKTAEDAWANEVTRWGGESAIEQHWQRIRTLPVEYVECNLLQDREPLLDRLDDRPNSAIWWSNVFFTFYSNWHYATVERRKIFEDFVRDLAKRSPRIFMYGNDCNNISVDGMTAGEYWHSYSQAAESELEPRMLRSLLPITDP